MTKRRFNISSFITSCKCFRSIIDIIILGLEVWSTRHPCMNEKCWFSSSRFAWCMEGSFSEQLSVSGLRLEIKTSWKALLLPEANFLPHSEYEGEENWRDCSATAASGCDSSAIPACCGDQGQFWRNICAVSSHCVAEGQHPYYSQPSLCV